MPYVPSPRELGSLARLALNNASDLLADARTLLDSETYPRALALATLAAEEFGKHTMCVTAVILDPSDIQAWRKFWRRFRSHEPKLTNWLGQLVEIVSWDEERETRDEGVWDDQWGSLPETVRQGLELKMAALYVDFHEGMASTPRQVVSAELAQQVVDSVALVIESAEKLWSGVDLESSLERHALEFRELGAMMDRARARGDFAAALEAANEFFSRRFSPGDRSEKLSRRSPSSGAQAAFDYGKQDEHP